MALPLYTEEDLTHDAFLGGKLQITQLKQGYRAGTDAVCLGAAIPVRGGHSVLDVGSGVGTASLCMAWRQPECSVTMIEKDPLFAALARRNIDQNHRADRCVVYEADLQSPPSKLHPQSFDHVMTNPPYFHPDQWFASPTKHQTHSHDSTTLESWIHFCYRMVRPKGTLTIIHRVDHVDLLCHLLYRKVGELSIFPLWPRPSREAHRVLIQGRKGSKGASRILPGLMLQDAEGKATPEAERIAREGLALDLTKPLGTPQQALPLVIPRD